MHWCPECRRKVGTYYNDALKRTKYATHSGPNGKRCPNSQKPVPRTERPSLFGDKKDGQK